MKGPSPQLFVRGKYQLARYEPGSRATGRRLTRREVTAAYGQGILDEIDEHLSAVLLKSAGAIEQALLQQRQELGVERNQLASAAEVSPEVVRDAETNAHKVPIRKLEHLAFVLGLDPAQLSFDETAAADEDLRGRLRVLQRDEDPRGASLSPRTVLRLAEAASIVSSQSRLQDWLEEPGEAEQFEPSPDYGPRAWRAGYRLALDLRKRLGIGLEPVPSMRELVEDRLGIPIIQASLPAPIAGATVLSRGKRGIVLNVEGANTNVWIRRTTLAHELAHVLFDPEERLSRVRVDSYEQLERDTKDTNHSQDVVEQRANAFAVEFLAPRDAVKQLVPQVAHVSAEAVGNVMSRFGIGRAAARYHVGNAWWGQAELPPESSIGADPTDEQRAAERFTLDFFPIESTPYQRRGRFAPLAAKAVEEGLITADTAALYLACSETEFEEQAPHLLGLA